MALSELKAQGKAVLVISHDDRYFHLGDRLLKLEERRLLTSDKCRAASDVPQEGWLSL